MATEYAQERRGGGFRPAGPTAHGGPNHDSFVEAVRTLQFQARAADTPDEVITRAADLIEAAANPLAPDGAGRLLDGAVMSAEANVLFVKLMSGQP